MNLFWPEFHDPSYRPGFRDRMSIHWSANLRMLRHPRDMVVFTVISFLPLALLLLFVEAFPGFLATDAMAPDLQSVLLRVIAVAVVLLGLQHLAFVVAMNLTYVGHVRSVLRDRGIPVCEQCGQRLGPSSEGTACPECGHPASLATMSDSVPPDVDV